MNEEYPIKHKGPRVAKIIYVDFSDAESRADNAVVMHLCMYLISAIKNEVAIDICSRNSHSAQE